jgi:hypothetical protein
VFTAHLEQSLVHQNKKIKIVETQIAVRKFLQNAKNHI